MIQIHTMPQKSEEWFRAKDGLMSASNATAIRSCGTGLKTYCRKLAREKMGIISDSFSNPDMDRGNILESEAIICYELETGLTVTEVGGITNSKYPNVWISPDGLIGEKGGCEVKARNDDKHDSLIQGDEEEIPKNQIQMSLLISEREWWDFISYNPNFKRNPIFVKRIYPDLAYFNKLKAGFKMGNMLIPEYIEKHKNYKFNI